FQPASQAVAQNDPPKTTTTDKGRKQTQTTTNGKKTTTPTDKTRGKVEKQPQLPVDPPDGDGKKDNDIKQENGGKKDNDGKEEGGGKKEKEGKIPPAPGPGKKDGHPPVITLKAPPTPPESVKLEEGAGGRAFALLPDGKTAVVGVDDLQT